jgi:putative SOS response-associated peptidase YedK
MCYHTALTVSPAELAQRFEADVAAVADFAPTYHTNGFEFKPWPVLTAQAPHTFRYLQWGLVPGWAKGTLGARKLQSATLNARCETLAQKPAFREAYQRGRRCLIPFSGFFEWQQVGKKKYPYYIRLKDQPIGTFAGLWDEWLDPDSGELNGTFTIITTPANPLMALIHNSKERMPAVLLSQHERIWLDPGATETELREVLAPIPEELLVAHTVRPLSATSLTTPSQQVLEPYNYPELTQRQQSLF